MANNLLMPGLSYFRHKLFEIQAFYNQAHIINFTDIIIYFCGTYYLYAIVSWILRGGHLQAQLHASVVRMHAETKSRPPGKISNKQLESLVRNK